MQYPSVSHKHETLLIWTTENLMGRLHKFWTPEFLTRFFWSVGAVMTFINFLEMRLERAYIFHKHFRYLLYTKKGIHFFQNEKSLEVKTVYLPVNAASNSFFSRCINCENEPETFLYKPWSLNLPKFARTTQRTALVSDKIVNDVPKTYFINRAGRDLPNYIWTQLQTDLFPDTGLINAFSD